MSLKAKLATLALIFFTVTAYAAKTETAIFAGGCFWSMQHDFENLNGVMNTTVGYTGGTVQNPSYEQVSTGSTGHLEAIKIEFDPQIISYAKLLDFYWHDIDPTDSNGQFCDKGREYHSAIFYANAEQKKMADQSMNALMKTKRFNQIMTQIVPAATFYPAEDYHQHYSDKNPEAYGRYRSGCQRDQTLNAVWGS